MEPGLIEGATTSLRERSNSSAELRKLSLKWEVRFQKPREWDFAHLSGDRIPERRCRVDRNGNQMEIPSLRRSADETAVLSNTDGAVLYWHESSRANGDDLLAFFVATGPNRPPCGRSALSETK